MEFHKNRVNDRSRKVGGKQCIVTLEGHVIPLQVKNGLDPDYEDEFVDAQEEQEDEDADISDEIETDDAGNDKISAFLSKQKRLEPGDIRKGLATARSMSGPVNCQQCCT